MRRPNGLDSRDANSSKNIYTGWKNIYITKQKYNQDKHNYKSKQSQVKYSCPMHLKQICEYFSKNALIERRKGSEMMIYSEVDLMLAL